MKLRSMVILIGTAVLVGCGGATQTGPDPTAVALAVSATLAAMPTPTAMVAEVTRVVELAAVEAPTPQPTATPIPEETPVPTIHQLIPPRKIYFHPYQVQEEYDRFKGLTKVNLEPDHEEMSGLKQGSLWVSYSYDGETPTPPALVGFSLWSVNDDWEYLDCHTLDLLVDGSPMSLDTDHRGEVMSGGFVSETVIGYLGAREFLTIANAKVVEGRLCSAVFKLSNDQMQALRDVASRMGTRTIEDLVPTQPPPAYDLALVKVTGQGTTNGFTVAGTFHNLGDKTTPQLIVTVTFENTDTGSTVEQQQTIGPLDLDASQTFSFVNADAGNWSYMVELSTLDGNSLRYRDLSE